MVQGHEHAPSELKNSDRAFPNAIKIVFSGTPLITTRHDWSTVQRFGKYIDRYKLQEAQADGAALPIVYIGRTVDTAIDDKSSFDKKFDDIFAGKTPEELVAIKEKHSNRDAILEAEPRISDVAAGLVRHYVENNMPDGFKAQVVCISKRATMR